MLKHPQATITWRLWLSVVPMRIPSCWSRGRTSCWWFQRTRWPPCKTRGSAGAASSSPAQITCIPHLNYCIPHLNNADAESHTPSRRCFVKSASSVPSGDGFCPRRRLCRQERTEVPGLHSRAPLLVRVPLARRSACIRPRRGASPSETPTHPDPIRLKAHANPYGQGRTVSQIVWGGAPA